MQAPPSPTKLILWAYKHLWAGPGAILIRETDTWPDKGRYKSRRERRKRVHHIFTSGGIDLEYLRHGKNSFSRLCLVGCHDTAHGD